jgi:hypothetical protein
MTHQGPEPSYGCPFCGADKCDVYYDDPEIDAECAVQECLCNRCGRRWREAYKFYLIEVIGQGPVAFREPEGQPFLPERR